MLKFISIKCRRCAVVAEIREDLLENIRIYDTTPNVVLSISIPERLRFEDRMFLKLFMDVISRHSDRVYHQKDHYPLESVEKFRTIIRSQDITVCDDLESLRLILELEGEPYYEWNTRVDPQLH